MKVPPVELSFLLKKSFRACCPAERSQLLGRGWCREAWCLWSEGPWGTHRPRYAPTQHLGSLFNGCLHVGCRGRGPWFTHNCGPAQIPRWGEHTVPPTPTPTRREGCEAVDICKTETKTQTQRTNMDTKGGNGNRTNWEITIDTYTPLTPHIKQITNENLLWSTGTLLSELW